MANISDFVERLAQDQRRMTETLGFRSSLDAFTKTTEKMRSQLSASSRMAEAIRLSTQPHLKAIEDSVLFRDLRRAAEQRRRVVDRLTEPIRRLQESQRPIFEYLARVRSDYEGLNRNLLRIDPTLISAAADCVVAQAQRKIAISKPDGDNIEVEIDDPGEILAPVVHDLKKSPSFAPLLFYVTMTLTTIVMSVVPSDYQHEARRWRDLLLALPAFLIICDKLDKSWQKIAIEDENNEDEDNGG